MKHYHPQLTDAGWFWCFYLAITILTISWAILGA